MVSKRKLNMQEESSMSWSQMMEEAAALSSSTRRSRNRYVGVRQRPSGRWVAEIKDTIQKIRMWLGTYDTAEQAARAYDEAACLLRGSNTRTNFSSTSSPPALPSKISKLLLNRLKERNHVTTNETPPLITNENTINNDSVVTTVDDRVDFGFVDELLLDVDKECYCSPFEVAEEIMRPLENDENDVMWKYERTFSASLYAFNGVSECLKKLEEKKDEDEEGMMMMMGCCWTSDDDDLSAFGFDFV